MSKELTEWDRVAAIWDAEAADEGIWHQRNDIDPVIFKILGKVNGQKSLEIGCGNGYFARKLSIEGAKVTGIDLSKKLLEFAIKKEQVKPLGVRYLVRNAANLHGLKSNSFDIAVANMSLMDIADLENATREVSRVLKRKGRFVFSITHPVFCDFSQQWTIVKRGRKKYLARAIHKYVTSWSGKVPLSPEITITNHHRSIETYFQFLFNSGFLIKEFREITTKKKVAKATKKHGDVKLRRSKYTTISEKKMKELAGREIPLFLIVEALKVN